MTDTAELERRIFERRRGRRWTHRRWWIRAGAISVKFAIIARLMRHPAEAAQHLADAARARRIANSYGLTAAARSPSATRLQRGSAIDIGRIWAAMRRAPSRDTH